MTNATQRMPLYIKLLAGLVGVVLFGAMMLSLTHSSAVGMADCPMVVSESSWCTMSLDHLTAWKSVFTATFTTILTLLIAATAFCSYRNFFWLYTARAPGRHLRPPHASAHVHHHSVRPLQDLFADGILHAKLH